MRLMKEAPTRFDAVRRTTQVGFVDLQANPHFANFQPAAAFGFSVKVVALRTISWQSGGQLMPFGALVTFPWPLTPTLSVLGFGREAG